MMDEVFDPYLNWLGIPPQEQPPDHYRLLGLSRFESDPRRIEAASDERMAEIRRYQSGPRMVYTQRLLKEISVARLCLLDIQSKASYDTVLRGRQSLNSIGWEEPASPAMSIGPHHPPAATQHFGYPQPAPSPYAAGPQPYGMPPAYAGPPPYAPSPSYAGHPQAPPFPSTSYPPPHDHLPMAPPIASPPIDAPPINAPPINAPPIDAPPMGPPSSGSGNRGRRTTRDRASGGSSGAARGATKPGRTGTGKRRSGPTRDSAASPEDSPPDDIDGAPLEDSRSLFRSSWFMPTLILLGVGGILAMWIIVRSGAFRQDEQTAGLGDRDGRIEESVDDMDTASGSSGDRVRIVGATAGKQSGNGMTSGRQTTHSTIDNPFGAVELIQEGTGELHFSAATAEREGAGLTLETVGNDSVVVGWASPEQTLVWSFRLAKPDIFRVELVYAASEESRGAQFALQVDDEDPKANAVEPTGASDKFRTDILHLTVRRSGKHQLRIAVQDLPMGGAIALKSLRFAPKGLSDRKK
ncbi:MAG: hypothetical protein ACKO38_04915 [Planctomycetota bacterium]